MYAGENGRQRPMVIHRARYIKVLLDAERFKLLYMEGRKEVKKLKEHVARGLEEIVQFKSQNDMLLKELKEKDRQIFELQQTKPADGNTGTVSIPRDMMLTVIMPSFNNLSSKIKQINEDVERTMSTIENACVQTGLTDRQNYETVRNFFLAKEKEDESVIPLAQDTVFFQGPCEWYTCQTVENIDEIIGDDRNTIVPPASKDAFDTVPTGRNFYETVVRDGNFYTCIKQGIFN